MRKGQALLILGIALLYILLNPYFNGIMTDSAVYITGIKENNIDVFDKPLLYNIVHPFYVLSGSDLVFYIFPLLFSLISFGAIIAMFDLYKIDLKYLVIQIPAISVSFYFLFQFMRDSLLFAIANVFFYCCLKYLESKKTHWFFIALPFAGLGYLTKMGGFLLFVVCAFLILRHKKEVLALFLDPYGMRVYVRYLIPAYAASIVMFAVNPIYIVCVPLIYWIKDNFMRFIVLLMWFSSYFVGNVYDHIHVYRYAFFFTGIGMLMLGQLMQQHNRGKWIIIAWLVFFFIETLVYNWKIL